MSGWEMSELIMCFFLFLFIRVPPARTLQEWVIKVGRGPPCFKYIMPLEESIRGLYSVFEIRRNLSGTVYRYVLPLHLCRTRIRPEHALESGIKTFVCVGAVLLMSTRILTSSALFYIIRLRGRLTLRALLAN